MTTPTIDTIPTAEDVLTATTEESRILGITSFVLGLASIAFGYTVLVPIAAIVIGAIALNRETAGRNYSVWGIVIASVSLALPVIALIFGLAVIAPFGIFALFLGQ